MTIQFGGCDGADCRPMRRPSAVAARCSGGGDAVAVAVAARCSGGCGGGSYQQFTASEGVSPSERAEEPSKKRQRRF